jgi:hypothetical protein
MFSINYLLNKIESAGLNVPVVADVRALTGRPLLPAEFDQRTAELADELAAGLADGTLDGEEIARRAAEIDGRRGGSNRAITAATKRARQIVDTAARRMLAEAGPAIVKELDRKARELRDAVASSTRSLLDAGVLLGDMDARSEAMQLGPITAAAWATREAATAALGELARTRKELADLQLIPAQTAAAERAERRSAAKAEQATKSFGAKVAELMPGGR